MTGDALVGPGRNHEPDPLVRLATELRDLRRYVDDKSAQILRTAGLRAEPDLLRVLGSLVVEGDLSVPSGVINLAGVDQDLAAAVNASITSASYAGGAGGMGFATTSGTGSYSTPVLAVPSYCKRVIVMATAIGRCLNSTGATIYFLANPGVTSSTGQNVVGTSSQITLANGFQGAANAALVGDFTFPGVAGQTLSFTTYAFATAAVAADAANYAGLEYVALMTRT